MPTAPGHIGRIPLYFEFARCLASKNMTLTIRGLSVHSAGAEADRTYAHVTATFLRLLEARREAHP